MSNDPKEAPNSSAPWAFSTREASLKELLTLRFQSRRREAEFLRYYLPISVFQSRFAFLLAGIFLISDYAADSIYYHAQFDFGNASRVFLLSPSYLIMFGLSFLSEIKKRYELSLFIFFILSSFCLFWILYNIDNTYGAGLHSVVGLLNLFFDLLFGLVLFGTRFYTSLISTSIVTVYFIILLFIDSFTIQDFYYLTYQIFTIFALCLLLGFTREFILRADFITQVALIEVRLAHDRINARYLEWLRNLAAFLRHEVRHPLAQINSSLEVIKLSASYTHLNGQITSASRGVEHVWNLIERASQATDAEAFVRQAIPQRIDIAALVSDAVELFRRLNFGVVITAQIIDHVIVNADPILIRQALTNLLSNAASFASDQSEIVVRLTIDDSRFICAKFRFRTRELLCQRTHKYFLTLSFLLDPDLPASTMVLVFTWSG